jgi:hypothetical protein
MQHSNPPVTAVGLGRHIGLRLALDALTLEIGKQPDLAQQADEFHSASRHELWRVRGDYRTGRPLVLLCFENLAKHRWDGCHRTLFRTWWRTHTGLEIPELGSHPA